MNASDRARLIIDLGTIANGNLARDILAATPNPAERNEILGGVLAFILRKFTQAIPLPVDRNEWLSAIIKMAVEP